MSRIYVVTPTYGTEDNGRLALLLQTIASVRRQAPAEYLHVVVDDGSTDATPEVLDRLANDDARLKVFHKTNGGSSAAVNHGIERALAFGRPDYLTVLHSDDLLLPGSLALRAEAATKGGAAWVYGDGVVLYETGPRPLVKPAPDHATAEALFEALLHGGGIAYPTMLWRADFFLDRVGGYDEPLTSAEDWDVALRSARELVATGERHVTLHEPTVVRRKHANALSLTDKHDGTLLRAYEYILAKYVADPERAAALARERYRRHESERFVGLKRVLASVGLLETARRVRHGRVSRPWPAPRRTLLDVDPPTAVFLREMAEVDLALLEAGAA